MPERQPRATWLKGQWAGCGRGLWSTALMTTTSGQQWELLLIECSPCPVPRELPSPGRYALPAWCHLIAFKNEVFKKGESKGWCGSALLLRDLIFQEMLQIWIFIWTLFLNADNSFKISKNNRQTIQDTCAGSNVAWEPEFTIYFSEAIFYILLRVPHSFLNFSFGFYRK